jgi:spore coat protein JB
MNMGMNQRNNRENPMEKKKLMKWINHVSFIVVDLAEYLDTHPDDEEALEYFCHYNKLRQQALEEYGAMYGPLTHEFACDDKQFIWATQKWPWEGGEC